MRILLILLTGWTFLLGPLCPLAGAALPIDLEVATQSGVPLTAPQQWAKLLGRMDLGSVQLRGMRGQEQPKLEARTVGSSTRYHLLAVLTSGNELVLPKAKFRVSDSVKLRKHLELLPAEAAHNATERGRFGLTEAQFRQLYGEFSQPVEFPTADLSPREVFERLSASLTVSLKEASRPQRDKPLGVELRGFSTGMAMTFALRCEGLALFPEQPMGERMQLRIDHYDPKRESWPVGWKPATSPKQLAPQLYVPRNIELKGFTLSQALSGLQPAIKVPVVLDQWILDQEAIDPAIVQVEVPMKRTFLNAALRKILSQAKLTGELRTDEQDQPFLWVTRFGQTSKPATD